MSEDVKIPTGRTLEQQIGFARIAISMTERYAGEEWAEKQLDKLTIELVRLENEQKRRHASGVKAKTLYIDYLRKKMAEPRITRERRRQIKLKIKRLEKKLEAEQVLGMMVKECFEGKKR